jgi:hypothetical protein
VYEALSYWCSRPSGYAAFVLRGLLSGSNGVRVGESESESESESERESESESESERDRERTRARPLLL